ncbi:UNVERIFIED_ORG: hypothetical protein CLV66_10298 [Actinomadura viridilutea]
MAVQPFTLGPERGRGRPKAGMGRTPPRAALRAGRKGEVRPRGHPAPPRWSQAGTVSSVRPPFRPIVRTSKRAISSGVSAVPPCTISGAGEPGTP